MKFFKNVTGLILILTGLSIISYFVLQASIFTVSFVISSHFNQNLLSISGLFVIITVIATLVNHGASAKTMTRLTHDLTVIALIDIPLMAYHVVLITLDMTIAMQIVFLVITLAISTSAVAATNRPARQRAKAIVPKPAYEK